MTTQTSVLKEIEKLKIKDLKRRSKDHTFWLLVKSEVNFSVRWKLMKYGINIPAII